MATSKKKRPKSLKYSEETMQAACQAVLKEKKSLREAGRLFGVPPSTLKDRLKGKKSYLEVQRTVITADEEERLVAWMRECVRRGFGRTMRQVQRSVQSILNDRKAVTIFKDNLPGSKWVSLFLKRHKNISLRTPQALGAQRAAVTEGKVRGWFETAEREIKEVGGDVLEHPSRIFNCDESGFQLGGGGNFHKVLADKSDKRVYQVSTDTRTQITVLGCGSAAGEMLKPLIIFPGQRFSYDPLEEFPEAHFAKSHNGWIDAEIFTEWLRTAFIPEVKHIPKPLVLFADGHKTHLTLTVSELCRDNGIILYLLPSHASHLVQPLDLTTFKLMKQLWREEVMDYQEEFSDTVGKREFAGVFKKTWMKGIKKDVVISGFRAAGISPWNPDHVDMTKLGPSRLYEETGAAAIPAETSSSSHVSFPLHHATGPTEEAATPTEEAAIPAETSSSFHVSFPLHHATGSTGETAVPAETSSSSLQGPTAPTEVLPMINPPSPIALPPLPIAAPTEEPEDFPMNPRSPTFYPAALPPLLESQLPSCVTTETLSSSDIAPSIITAVPPSSSHIPSTSAPASSSSLNDNIGLQVSNNVQALDRLLDLTAKIGTDGLIQYRSLHTLGMETDDPEERLFSILYSNISSLISISTSPTVNSVEPEHTFDNLPLPSHWKKKKRQMIQPPKMVSSEEFREFISDNKTKKTKSQEVKENKKKEREEKKKEREEKEKEKEEEKEKEREQKEKEREEKEKEREEKEKEREEKKKEREEKKKEREEKKKRTENEKERKRQEQERKKKEQEEKKGEKEKKILKAKKTKNTTGTRQKKVDNDIDEKESLTSWKCVDNDGDIDMKSINELNENICFVCEGENDSVL